MSRLIGLYPRAWRARYGEELELLVAHRPLGVLGVVDLLRGALDAHLHPELVDPLADPAAARPAPVSPKRLEDLRVARRFGLGAWLGAAFWITGWVVAANGPLVTDEWGTYRDGGAGMPFILVAMILLSAGLLGQLVRLPAGCRVARAGAITALLALPLWGLGPWNMPILLIGLVGLVALAIGARFAGAWGTAAATVVVAAATGGATIAMLAFSGLVDGRADDLLDPVALAVLALTPIWLVVGGTLVRLPPVEPAVGGGDATPFRQPAT